MMIISTFVFYVVKMPISLLAIRSSTFKYHPTPSNLYFLWCFGLVTVDSWLKNPERDQKDTLQSTIKAWCYVSVGILENRAFQQRILFTNSKLGFSNDHHMVALVPKQSF